MDDPLTLGKMVKLREWMRGLFPWIVERGMDREGTLGEGEEIE
jgi:hypothetical protein